MQLQLYGSKIWLFKKPVDFRHYVKFSIMLTDHLLQIK
jgi:hypothetical protein